jgi:adenosylcobinamide-GDP ribazoletransferase
MLARIFPPVLAAALVVALWAALTGGLHLDGLTDCGDGLLAAVSPARRLEIMRDPRTGAFGVISLVLFLILKVAAVASLPAAVVLAWPSYRAGVDPAWLPAGALVMAPLAARWMLLPAAGQPTARPGGLGSELAAHLGWPAFIAAALTLLAVTLLGGPRAVAAVVGAHLAALMIFGFARARLGGLTGDVFGLTVEVVELCVLLVYGVSLGAAT